MFGKMALPQRPSADKKKILLLDDDGTVRELRAEILKLNGFEVEGADIQHGRSRWQPRAW